VNLSTGAVNYLLSDMLGSVRGIVSSAGALTATTAYDAWGNPQTTGGLTAYTPFGFAGGFTDPTGLIYLIDRYYDPKAGQFLSIDPDVAATGSPYGYAGQDPVNATDPTGDRPKGLGYLFQIGRGFNWAEGQAFMESIMCTTGAVIGYLCYPQLSLTTGLETRVVDLWTGNNNVAEGAINEVKTGYQANSGLVTQANKDNWLLNNHGGWTGGSNRHWYYIWNGAWWFLPSSTTLRSGSSSSFYQKLINDGMNILLFIYRKGTNDSKYNNKIAGSYAMWDAAMSKTPVSRVYHYYPPLALSACPAGAFWVYP
jgi:RHS repeat-associated protein